MSNDNREKAPPAGLRVTLLQSLVKICINFANMLAKPIAKRRLLPMQIPFRPENGDTRTNQPATRKGEDNQEETDDDGEEESVMPEGSAGWGPVSGGYWGLDGEFHTWTGVPPVPPPPPPPIEDDSSGDSPPNDNQPPPPTTPEEEAAAAARERRIRELEDEMDRILEEMQIMWPLLEDFLREEFEARRREILELDPDWTPPGVRPPRPDEDDAPPLEFPEDEPPPIEFPENS